MAVGTHILPSEVLTGCTQGTLYCIAKWASDVTGGAFWTFMLLGFCIAIYIATARLGNTRAFGYSSFVGMNGAIFLAITTLIPWWIASVYILVGAIGLASMVMAGKE